MTDRLHTALKTEQIGQAQQGSVSFLLTRLQHGKNDIAYSLHANPTGWTSAGIQTSDFLSHLGFQRSPCAFLGRECFVRAVREGLPLAPFAQAFEQGWVAFQGADRALERCGLPMAQPEGWGYFHGKPSGAMRRRRHPGGVGDGHTATTSQRLKASEDEVFRCVLSWLEGGTEKGWTTHYQARHPPLSEEIEAALEFLGGFSPFPECPQFDFEPCLWRFVLYESRDDSPWDSNAEFVHSNFDAHAENVTKGLRLLITAHAALQPYDVALLPVRPRPVITASAASRGPVAAATRRTSYKYDVALSFAGPERPLAEELAHRLRDAGTEVFYDHFYPEHLWGKDLASYFDQIYRKEAQLCVIFVSQEYTRRMWTNVERRSAVARSVQERGNEYILPIEVEEAELEGVPPTIGRLSLDQHPIPRIAELLLKKLGQ